MTDREPNRLSTWRRGELENEILRLEAGLLASERAATALREALDRIIGTDPSTGIGPNVPSGLHADCIDIAVNALDALAAPSEGVPDGEAP